MVKHVKELGTWLMYGADDCSTSKRQWLQQRDALEAWRTVKTTATITVTHLNSRISLHDALSTPLQPHHSHTPHQSDITTSQHSNTSRRREISFLPWECFKYTVCHSSSHSLSGHSAVHCSLMTTCYPHWCHLVVGSSGPQHSLTCQS